MVEKDKNICKYTFRAKNGFDLRSGHVIDNCQENSLMSGGKTFKSESERSGNRFCWYLVSVSIESNPTHIFHRLGRQYYMLSIYWVRRCRLHSSFEIKFHPVMSPSTFIKQFPYPICPNVSEQFIDYIYMS